MIALVPVLSMLGPITMALVFIALWLSWEQLTFSLIHMHLTTNQTDAFHVSHILNKSIGQSLLSLIE